MIKSIVATGLFLSLAAVKLEAVLPEGVTVIKEGSRLIIQNNSAANLTFNADWSGNTRYMDGFAYKVHGNSTEILKDTPEHIKRKILDHRLAEHRQFLNSLTKKPVSDWSQLHRLTNLAIAGGMFAASKAAAIALPALISPAPIAVAPVVAPAPVFYPQVG